MTPRAYLSKHDISFATISPWYSQYGPPRGNVAGGQQGDTIGYQMLGHLRRVIKTPSSRGEWFCETAAAPGASERSIATTRGRKTSNIFRAVCFFGDRNFTPKLVRLVFARVHSPPGFVIVVRISHLSIDRKRSVRLQETVSMTRSFRCHKKRLCTGRRRHREQSSLDDVKPRPRIRGDRSRRPQSVFS